MLAICPAVLKPEYELADAEVGLCGEVPLRTRLSVLAFKLLPQDLTVEDTVLLLGVLVLDTPETAFFLN